MLIQFKSNFPKKLHKLGVTWFLDSETNDGLYSRRVPLILDTVLELEELVHLLKKFKENEPIMTKIDEVGRKLGGSTFLKSRKCRLKVLLDDIAQNRCGMQTHVC